MTEWLAWIFAIPKVDTIDEVSLSFAQPALWFPSNGSPLYLGIGVLLLGIIALQYYRRYEKGSFWRWLGPIRALLLILVLLVLAEPILTMRISRTVPPEVWFLIDGSQSMDSSDSQTGTRIEQVRKKLEGEWLKNLTESGATGSASAAAIMPRPNNNTAAASGGREPPVTPDVTASGPQPNQPASPYRVRIFQFDRIEGVRGIFDSSESEEFQGNLTANGEVTAIGNALEELRRKQSVSNLTSIVLISDFDQNAGAQPETPARNLQVPIHTIGVGPTEIIDLGVELEVPLVLKMRERGVIRAVIQSTGMNGTIVRLKVAAHNLDQPNPPIVLLEQNVQLSDRRIPTDIDFEPTETGRIRIEATVVADPDADQIEANLRNNQLNRETIVRDDFLRLLYVEYEPTWEWRFIKEVFHRDPLVGERGFRTYLHSSNPKIRGKNPLFTTTLTPPRGEFFSNDVLFIGDLPQGVLNPRFCELVREFVGTFGGGLVILAGPRYGPGVLSETELAPLMPVVVDPGTRFVESDFALQFTPEAAGFDFMRLDSEAWKNLGPLSWYQPVRRPSPLTTILAAHPTDLCEDQKTPQPLIAIRRYGRGEVVYLGFNETWRLRRKFGEKYFRQFWGQLIYRLGLSHAIGARKRFVLSVDRDEYRLDEEIVLRLDAYDADFQPLKETEALSGTVQIPEEALPVPVSFVPVREGVFEARFRGSKTGEYQVRVKDPVTSEVIVQIVRVSSITAEQRSLLRNVALQEQISAASGGKVLTLDQLDEVQDLLPNRPILESRIETRPLWNTWLVFLLIAGLAVLEWSLRKWRHLP